IRWHTMIDERDAAVEPRRTRSEVVEALERDHRGREQALCAHAAAQAEERQRAIDRSNDARALRPAHPIRSIDRLEVDVLETVVAHLPGGPCDRLLERRRAGDPGPLDVAELGPPLPGRIG